MIKFIKQKYTNLMSDTRFSEIFTGSVWALSARVFTTFFALAFSVIVARFYGAEAVGIVAVINSFLLLTSIFTVVGTPTSVLRLIPEHLSIYSPSSAFKVYRKTQFLVIGISIAIGILFFLGADQIATKIFSKPHLSFYFGLGSLFIVFKSLLILNTEAIRGLRLIRMFALMQVLPQMINLTCLIAIGFFWHSQDVPIYAFLIGMAVAGVTGWIIMEYSFKKLTRQDDIVAPMTFKQIFSISIPMLMATSMDIIISRTGIIFLGIFRTEAEVGYFDIAAKLSGLTLFILGAVNSMAAPKFSQLFHSGNTEELFYVAKKSAKLIFWTTTPILFGFIILGKPILNVFFGHEFGNAYFALVIMVAGKFVSSISGSTGVFMNMTGNHNAFKNIMIVSGLISVIGNLLLIPRFGINGAAFVTMVSLSFWNIATLVYIKVKFGATIGYFPVLSHLLCRFFFSLGNYRNK